MIGHAGRDPAIDRIARHIRDAARQFLHVNPDRVMPNILVEVNHADPGNIGDLVEAVSGRRPHAEHESPVIWSTQPAKRLEGVADQIDLFLVSAIHQLADPDRTDGPHLGQLLAPDYSPVDSLTLSFKHARRT